MVVIAIMKSFTKRIIMKKIYVLVLLVAIITQGNLFAQGKNKKKEIVQIEQFVTDTAGLPVPGARVYGNEGLISVETDAEGFFSLGVEVNSVVMIEAENFEIKALTTTELLSGETIVLEVQKTNDKKEIYMPFDNMENRRINGAVTTIDPKEILKYDSRATLGSAITGRVPGFLGGNNNIYGLGNDPLIVVDGMPRAKVRSGVPGITPLDYNLEEIDEISVLKDASAKILYGARADQGVILITTKRGEKHKKVINVSGEFGIMQPRAMPEYVSSANFVRLYNEALENDKFGSDSPDQFESQKFSSQDSAGFAAGPSTRFPDDDYYSDRYIKPWHHTSRINTEI